MMPFFAAPFVLLLGAVALPALLTLYFLRNKRKRLPVSSLMLWSMRREETAHGARIQRLRTPLLFLLELFILILLVLAAAAPRWLADRRARPLIVLLDNSMSMRAVDRSGTDARTRALARIAAVQKDAKFAPIIVAVVGDRAERLDSDAAAALLKGKLDLWPAYAPRADWTAARDWAFSQGWKEPALLMVSDQAPENDVPPGTRWLACGSPAGNVGITEASRSGKRVMLTLLNASRESTEVELRGRTDGQPWLRKVALDANQRKRVTLDLPSAQSSFTAALPKDALVTDNEVFLLPSPQMRLRVRNDLPEGANQLAITTALESSGMLDKAAGSPVLWIAPPGVSVPPAARSAWQLRIHDAAGTNAVAGIGPFAMDRSARLIQGLDLGRVVWLRNEAQLPGAALVADERGALISSSQTLNGRPRFDMYLDANRSTLPRSPDWPILFWNLLELCADDRNGVSPVNARPGIMPELRSKGTEAVMTYPEGNKRSLALLSDATPLQLEEPGLYSVHCGEVVYPFAFNAMSAAESDLQFAEIYDSGAWELTTSQQRSAREMEPGLLLAALVLLAAHQYLVWKGVRA